MGRAGSEHPLVVVERYPRGHRDDDLRLQLFADRRDDRLDLVGFHGDDHHVGKRRDLGRRVEGPEAEGLRIALQFGPVAGAGPDAAGPDRAAAHQSAGQSPGHVSESDKSDIHNEKYDLKGCAAFATQRMVVV